MSITRIRPAGEAHQVVSVERDNGGLHCKSPCPECPWRKDAVGVFPAEAFRHSAETAQDLSNRAFGCHSSSLHAPLTCAGFLLSVSADHNLQVRLMRLRLGRLEDVSDGGLELFSTYREMAEANGVSSDDPALRGIR